MDFKEDVLKYIPGWIGFLGLILIGLAMTINGIANSSLDAANQLGFILFGLIAVFVGTFSWIAGGTSEVAGRAGKVGIKVNVVNLPWWAHVVNVVVVVAAVVIFMFAA